MRKRLAVWCVCATVLSALACWAAAPDVGPGWDTNGCQYIDANGQPVPNTNVQYVIDSAYEFTACLVGSSPCDQNPQTAMYNDYQVRSLAATYTSDQGICTKCDYHTVIANACCGPNAAPYIACAVAHAPIPR
jgi:hypothetical protein